MHKLLIPFDGNNSIGKRIEYSMRLGDYIRLHGPNALAKKRPLTTQIFVIFDPIVAVIRHRSRHLLTINRVILRTYNKNVTSGRFARH